MKTNLLYLPITKNMSETVAHDDKQVLKPGEISNKI